MSPRCFTSSSRSGDDAALARQGGRSREDYTGVNPTKMFREGGFAAETRRLTEESVRMRWAIYFLASSRLETADLKSKEESMRKKATREHR